MNHRGRHLLVELYGCEPRALDDAVALGKLLRAAAEAAGSRVVAEVFHPFAPHGVTGVVVIEESHLSVHTWPERGYAAVDFYTCGSGDPERALELVAAGLSAERVEVLEVTRGGEPELALQPSPRRRLPRRT